MYIQIIALELHSYARMKNTCNCGNLQNFAASVNNRIPHSHCMCSIASCFCCLGTRLCSKHFASCFTYTRDHIFLHLLVCRYPHVILYRMYFNCTQSLKLIVASMFKLYLERVIYMLIKLLWVKMKGKWAFWILDR
jgi:hypothetical protein